MNKFDRLVLKCKVACLYRQYVLRTNRTDERAVKRVLAYSTLFFIAVTNLFLSIQSLILIRFSLAVATAFSLFAGFILVAVLLQELIGSFL